MAAAAAEIGIDPAAFLHVGDRFELLILQQVVQRARELRELRDRNLAVLIANAVGRMLGGS